MPLDFDDMPVLIGPRRKMAAAEAGNRERLGRLKMMRARKHGKRHATNQERSHEERLKARHKKIAADRKRSDKEAYDAQVRAYWLGERDTHP